MKNLLIITAIALASAVLFTMSAADKPTKARKLQHVVCFKYKDGTSPEKIAEVEAAFRALKEKIPGIVAFECGVNNSPEGKNKGFTHAYILTFTNEKDRDGYLPHPEHKKFGGIAGPVLADVFVMDFWAE
ncbi:MAG: Dabb family protein [Verrucomicrobia bacterium]|nr:Dabb family protein [Verrucomicrobiota bacterium]